MTYAIRNRYSGLIVPATTFRLRREAAEWIAQQLYPQHFRVVKKP